MEEANISTNENVIVNHKTFDSYGVVLNDENRVESWHYPALDTDEVIVKNLPWAEQGNPWDYKYENGEFVFDAIEMPTQTPVPTDMEKLQAQIDYLSMMTEVDL